MLGSVQPLPPKQQPQLQQQQQQQQQNQNGADVPPPPLNGQDFTLSNVLHFLQSEWRKYERDRNEWEIERAEMRARIALLEGERRSFENVKVDLMRRIKMLEYALRMERSKQLTQPSTAPHSKAVSAAQKEDGLVQKEGSSGSSPRSEDSPLPPEPRIPNGVASGHRPTTWAGAPATWSNASAPPPAAAVAALGKPPPGRDPKSRARSRDYLKQCLLEISYLTSPQAMNPLPTRPLVSNASLPVSLPNVPAFDQMAYNNRPRKLMAEVGKEFPPMNGINMMSGPSSATGAGQIPALGRNSPGPGMQQQQGQVSQPHTSMGHQFPPSQPSGSQTQQTSQAQDSEKEREPFESQQTTAIFRPDDAGEWKERLRQAHESADGSSWRNRDDDDDGKEEETEDDVSSVLGEGDGTKVWKTKRTLRNHLDAVRAITFHPAELCLATGGDDCTVKIWRMDVNGLASSAARPITEVEPQLTLRGHSAAITRLVIAPSKQLLYSASLDSTVRVWALPPANHTTYAPFDSSRLRGELIGHTDAVWDLALVRDESTLISCGAEGSVKVWDVTSHLGGILKLSWTYNGIQNDSEEREDLPGASAVEAIKVDLKKVAVAYQNATIKIFDIENGKELALIQLQPSSEGATNQVNSLVSHPTMPLLVAGHEDKYISIFDITTGQCTHSMPAHLDGVTSLSMDPSGFSLVSGGHDCSIRFWDILGTRACVQEITSHRRKADEGALDVQFHPSLPFMASAGADGVVKLYASS
ncbi:WD40-repeat-containing domain protein [Amylostereum chailletii]|nr:WD40-repeat-containing domain protein [Amylostereum chailletii]